MLLSGLEVKVWNKMVKDSLDNKTLLAWMRMEAFRMACRRGSHKWQILDAGKHVN